MTRQILVALWQFAGQVPKGSKIYEQIKAILIEELTVKEKEENAISRVLAMRNASEV